MPWDVSSYIYRFMYSQGQDRNKWLNPFINMLMLFRRNCVNVVPIFDGKAPPEKAEERADRTDQKTKTDERCLNLRLELDRYKKVGIRGAELVHFMKQLKIRQYNAQLATRFRSMMRPGSEKDEAKDGLEIGDDVEIDVAAIEGEIDQREKNLFTITPEDLVLLKGLLTVLKIPYMEAVDEAEAHCCYLIRAGLADAVFSLDSDCLAHLAPVIINEVDLGSGECRVLHLDEVLEELELTPTQLQLFCVLCGTDYNRAVKNVAGVGPVNALKLAREFDSMDALEKSGKLRPKEKDKPIELRYKRNIELFSLSYPEIKNVPVWDLRVDFAAVEAFVHKHSLSCDMALVRSLWKPPKVVFADEVEAEQP